MEFNGIPVTDRPPTQGRWYPGSPSKNVTESLRNVTECYRITNSKSTASLEPQGGKGRATRPVTPRAVHQHHE